MSMDESKEARLAELERKMTEIIPLLAECLIESRFRFPGPDGEMAFLAAAIQMVSEVVKGTHDRVATIESLCLRWGLECSIGPGAAKLDPSGGSK